MQEMADQRLEHTVELLRVLTRQQELMCLPRLCSPRVASPIPFVPPARLLQHPRHLLPSPDLLHPDALFAATSSS